MPNLFLFNPLRIQSQSQRGARSKGQTISYCRLRNRRSEPFLKSPNLVNWLCWLPAGGRGKEIGKTIQAQQLAATKYLRPVVSRYVIQECLSY